VPVSFKVLSKPIPKTSELARMGAKSQLYITCLQAPLNGPQSISFMTAGDALGSRPKLTKNSSYHF
jgi:acetyl-CoA carboxylase beta subunit